MQPAVSGYAKMVLLPLAYDKSEIKRCIAEMNEVADRTMEQLNDNNGWMSVKQYDQFINRRKIIDKNAITLDSFKEKLLILKEEKRILQRYNLPVSILEPAEKLENVFIKIFEEQKHNPKLRLDFDAARKQSRIIALD